MKCVIQDARPCICLVSVRERMPRPVALLSKQFCSFVLLPVVLQLHGIISFRKKTQEVERQLSWAPSPSVFISCILQRRLLSQSRAGSKKQQKMNSLTQVLVLSELKSSLRFLRTRTRQKTHQGATIKSFVIRMLILNHCTIETKI